MSSCLAQRLASGLGRAGTIRCFASAVQQKQLTTEEVVARDRKYVANNYAPMLPAISRAQGVHVWDVEGKQYLDFISGFSCVNQGHCHPRIQEALCTQAGRLTHTSRSHFNDVVGEFAEYVTQLLDFDKVLPMNTGVEGGETAVKLSRRWGYLKKKIPPNKAKVVFAQNNFWGRTLTAVSSSTDPVMFTDCGPFMPCLEIIPFNDLVALEDKLKDPEVAAFMVEPIQGEAGVIVPADGYLREVRRLCTKYNVLWIADEVQTGLGRTGAMLAVHHEAVKPDILILGKALAGAMYPVSAVLADAGVMDCFTPGTHGSTFGGNPLGLKTAITALQVIRDEGLAENAHKMGKRFLEGMTACGEAVPIVRGKGLLMAIGIDEDIVGSPYDFCNKLAENGLITKPCKANIIRFAPPLVITEQQMSQGLDIIARTLQQVCDAKQKRSSA